jgi:hypothetical protein
MDRGWGNPSFHLSQVLNGHGCFGEYLHRIGREATETCHECGADPDTAQHTLEGCPAFEEKRRALVQQIGPDLSLPTVIESMLGREQNWEAVASFCGTVIRGRKPPRRQGCGGKMAVTTMTTLLGAAVAAAAPASSGGGGVVLPPPGDGEGRQGSGGRRTERAA